VSVEDEHEIEKLVRRYALLNDAGRWDELAELFAEDATFTRPSAPDAPIKGKAAILASFRARPPRLARHLVCNTVVTLEGPNAATASSYSVLLTPGGPMNVGGFEDRFTRVGGGWKFAARVGASGFEAP
jgi:hypothetical protein